MTSHVEDALGRYLLAALFGFGALHKSSNPEAVQGLLAGAGWPEWLIWPALAFNALAALMLIADRHVRGVARLLALYCITTSFFHLIPSDPWQMSIFVKNWAIAGGLLILAGSRATTPA
jgi:putative oxidoreductase